MRIGTSFSPRRCAHFGLATEATFAAVLETGFDLVRLSAYWDEIHRDGYGSLERLLDGARAANQDVVLTVGMKAMQWPEFYVPPDLQPDAARGARIGLEQPLAEDVVRFVSETIARYRANRAIVAWQVENEPFNRSGPKHWWIDPDLVRREIDAVRALDSRPIILNAFNHFDRALDHDSRPRAGWLRMRRLSPERTILDLLNPGDVLGLDAYIAIGARRAATDWAAVAGHWLGEARRRDREAWIIEAQAEPWEEPGASYENPRSFSPRDIPAVFDALARARYTSILLWGCEYWLSRAAAGDSSWIEAARRVLSGRNG